MKMNFSEAYRFQSTPPVKAATVLHMSVRPKSQLFQSTPPVKAATEYKGDIAVILSISIHAAREGGDVISTSDKTK